MDFKKSNMLLLNSMQLVKRVTTGNVNYYFQRQQGYFKKRDIVKHDISSKRERKNNVLDHLITKVERLAPDSWYNTSKSKNKDEVINKEEVDKINVNKDAIKESIKENEKSCRKKGLQKFGFGNDNKKTEADYFSGKHS